MKYFRLFTFLIFMFFGNVVFAKSFSLQVIQKNGSENVVYDASYLIEQTILDYFYDNAYIISNSPVIIQKKNQNITAELQKSFDQAQEGYLDLYIEATVKYNLQDSNNPEEALLSNIDEIEWKVISLTTKDIVVSGTASPEKKYRDDWDSVVYFANELARNINDAVNSKGGKK